ncbi:hypothetical protein K2173_015629 [Erythroxylum novogranatense]|uniref:RING-type E3 ubiquitin transferase n=1 Tax=Erythroxylum novogranatense TaxID=1862640 RepID=A0AAV8SEP6_9ROSI|nr:hypothetical protein K2173_015629 [Erythroxylum novogranatense]
MSSTPTQTAAYWCYRCTRFVTAFSQTTGGVTCPRCNAGFVEEIQADSPQLNSPHRRFMYMLSNNNNNNQTPNRHRIPSHRFRRSRRNPGDRSPFNPVIVLRGSAADDNNEEGSNSYEFYYDDGNGSGLRPVPAAISEFLMGSGFERLLDQLSQIEMNGFGRPGNPPASKAVVEAMPRVEITEPHIVSEEHCAVCKEAFELGGEAREMPCKHMYHSDCILPWLAMRNSCPVCRHELPSEHEQGEAPEESVENSSDEEIVGLTIWRLPGGGFAVGRFNGGRRGGEREFPGVFTEMDGGFGGSGRRVSWVGGVRSRGRESGGGRIGRFFRGLASFFRRIGHSSESSNWTRSFSNGGSEVPVSISRSWSESSSGFGRRRRRRRRSSGLDMEIEDGTDRW